MIGAAERYIQLATELLLLRESNGGQLPDDVESSYIDQFDRCWRHMSADEQQEAERVVAQTSLGAPTDLQRGTKT
jgi:hypothetical protein